MSFERPVVLLRSLKLPSFVAHHRGLAERAEKGSRGLLDFLRELAGIKIAERYERRSVLITSNLGFSEWDRIFKDSMTTAAAINRLVHHAVVLDMTGPSIRAKEASFRLAAAQGEAHP